MTLGERIYYLRQQQRLSQEQLAEKVGVSRQAVSKWELDTAQPEIDKVIAIARLFSVSTDVLLGLQVMNEDTMDSESERGCVYRVIEFLRKLWHNVAYFSLIWGASISIMSLLVSIAWRQMEVLYLQAAFFVGLFAFICGLVLVLFRNRRNGRDRS